MGQNGRHSPFQLIRNPDVPIVGQPKPAIVHDVRVLAMISCQCDPAAPPLLIGHQAGTATCKACGAIYAIGEIEYHREPDMKVRISVGRLSPIAPAAEAPTT